MRKFILTRPKTVLSKVADVEYVAKIEVLHVDELTGDPDQIEIEARGSLIRSGSNADGSDIEPRHLDGLDVSSAIRDAYHQALGEARAALNASINSELGL